MLSFFAKAAFAGIVTALVVVVAKRWPSWGGLVAALPLTSILAMSLLYAETGDSERVAALSTSVLAFIIPSLPMFIAIPVMLRNGVTFWLAMTIAVVGTLVLYGLSFFMLSRMGFKV
ncbi:DUF3147 family protein [Sphingomicrobium nitratireducens]|uniref:DUF3147 family protein n=1 Tax=Sphingomicrobium nitratireducens TaxID=2964666 RepID=UPI002240B62D|nr:DUF3147 family protein [Sphingomicrobium nitratireducens]